MGMEQEERTQQPELQSRIARYKSWSRVALFASVTGLILGLVISLISFFCGGSASVTEDYGAMWLAVVFLYIGIAVVVIGLLSLFTALIIRSRCAFLEKRAGNSTPELKDAGVSRG
jgi:uncharacterized membrane protein YdbT with pleckstrin-like domain